MKYADKVKLCKYYKGENESPFINNEDSFKDTLWNIERYWCLESAVSKDAEYLFDLYKDDIFIPSRVDRNFVAFFLHYCSKYVYDIQGYINEFNNDLSKYYR